MKPINNLDEPLLENRPAQRARRGIVYGALLGGTVLFVWPLLWMVGTSFKSGREILTAPTTFIPGRPIPRSQSPYLETRRFDEFSDVAKETWRPLIEQRLHELNYPWPDYTTPEEAIRLTARGVLQRLAETLPEATWKLPSPSLLAALSVRIDSALVKSVFDQIQRRLLLGQLRIRSYDIQEQELIRADHVATAWQVEGSAPAYLENVPGESRPFALLHYHFSPGKAVRLSRVFPTEFSMDRLYRLQLYLQYDDSWHRLKVYVEKLGVLYQAVESVPLGDPANWNVLTWQEPGPDDRTNKIRTWIHLRAIDRGPQYVSDPHQLKVTVEIKQSNVLQAWWEKIRRNYVLALDYIPFWRYFATSLFLVILTVIGTLFSCSLVAYSFARLKWPGRDLCFGLMLATLMIPPQVTMIPQFLIVRKLDWYNTLYPLWVPHFFGAAFYIFLLRQFLKGIPRDLEEAARIDGCGFFRIYWHIMLPLIKPTLAAIAILTFISTWNDFMGPLIYVNDQHLYPLPFGLYAFTIQSSLDAAGLNMGMTMAGSLLMTLPVIVIFIFAQKYFIQGVTLSGMKG